MVTKEPIEHYKLKGEYLFRNFITGREANMWGRSNPTRSKMCWEMLPTLREQAIDRAKNWLALVLHIDNKEFKLQWFLVEILNEEFIKW
jgi:hypothetical protein